MTSVLQEFSYMWMPHYGSGEDPPILHKQHFHLTLTLKMKAARFLKDQQKQPPFSWSKTQKQDQWKFLMLSQ